MKITIIGCGNAGLIHAAKAFQKGNEICLLKTSNIRSVFYDKIVRDGGYRVKDYTDRGKDFFVNPAIVTRDVKVALDFADVIMVMTTTLQHESVAKIVSSYVRNGQTIILCPGYMGSLLFKQKISSDVTFCEWETTAYNGRIVDNEYVKITFYNPRNAISVLPKKKEKETLDLLSPIFDNTKYFRKNILESAIHNPNMIVHTIGMVLSASRIEYSNGEFWMYREAFTKSVVSVINEFDKQKNEVLKAYGCEPLDYFEAAKWRNEEDLSVDAMTSFNSFADSSNKGPSELRHRYLLEDVPMGLGLFISLAELANVKVPIATAIFNLASALLGEDFENQARTIQKLFNNPQISKSDVLSFLND